MDGRGRRPGHPGDPADPLLLPVEAVELAQGGTSGHVQHVESIHVDCDADVLLIRARQVGGACHEGYRNCFWRRVDADGTLAVDTEPVFAAEAVYGSKTAQGAKPA